jgi:hypothetical protein
MVTLNELAQGDVSAYVSLPSTATRHATSVNRPEVPIHRGRMVVSFFVAPGGVAMYATADSTI